MKEKEPLQHLAVRTAALASLAIACGVSSGAPLNNDAVVVSLSSLLEEMADRDALARFPRSNYRQLQASSYHRASVRRGEPGWFADSDGVSSIREETIGGATEWVIMEHDGPGCLTKLWTPYFYYGFGNRVGPRIKVYLDGADAPAIDETFIELLTHNEWPENYGPAPPQRNGLRVPRPFAGFTARAGNLYLPIPFAKSCKVTLDQKAFYNIVNYRAYPPGTAVETFSKAGFAAAKGQLSQIGCELLEPTEYAGGTAHGAAARIPPGESFAIPLAGTAAIRQLSVRLDPNAVKDRPTVLRSTVLAMTFDGEETVWCPLGDFFGSADSLHPMHTWTRTVTADGAMVCRWVMPFRKDAVVSLVNLSNQSLTADVQVRTGPWEWGDRSMHFWARWRSDDVQPGNRFSDWNFVDIRGRGGFIGDTWTVLNPTTGWWGEGDEKIYVDGSYERLFPDHFGTGTEDYYGWAGGRVPTRADVFSHPFLANISVGTTERDTPRGFNICTRVRGLDAIPFTSRLVFDMEASPGTGQRNAWDFLGYSAVTYWYARPGATANRPPLSAAAAKPIVSLDDLDKRARAIREKSTKRIPGAIEFENLAPSAHSAGLRFQRQVPAAVQRPEQFSGHAHMFLPFRKPGEYVEFRLTEQFQPRDVTLYITKSYDFAVAQLSINGRVVRDELDLYSPTVRVDRLDLGVIEPRNNAFAIRLEMVRPNARSRGAKTLAGLDCVVLSPPR